LRPKRLAWSSNCRGWQHRPRRLEQVIECAAQVLVLHPRLEARTRASAAMARMTAVNLGNAALSEIGTQLST
jgi:hypothetical protein